MGKSQLRLNLIIPPPHTHLFLVPLPDNLQEHVKFFETMTEHDLHAKLLGEYLEVFTETLDGCRKLQSLFTREKFPYSWSQRHQTQEIYNSWSISGHSVQNLLSMISNLKAFKLKNRVTKLPMPLFLIALEPTPIVNEILNIKEINLLYIQSELYPGSRVKHCYRCQHYGYSSVTGSLTQKYIIRWDNHASSLCPSKKKKPRYANCGGEHPSNYKGCT